MTPCRTPWKIRHGSRAEALRDAKGFDKPSTRPKRGDVYAYHCECGDWHLTAMNASDKRALRRRRRAA